MLLVARHALFKVAPIWAALAIASCVSGGPVPQVLDEQTGVTVSHARTPLTLYRNAPSYGAHARNYLYTGPIEVNRMGDRRYFLWVGIWNTYKNTGTRKDLVEFESVVLFADGEPLLLDVVGWSPSAIDTSVPTYTRPVSNAVEAYYALSLPQLDRIVHASSLQMATSSSSTQLYETWNEQSAARSDWLQFWQSVNDGYDPE